jgi:hypothetical protein
LKKNYENFHSQYVNDLHVNFVRKMNSDTDKIIIEIMSIIFFLFGVCFPYRNSSINGYIIDGRSDKIKITNTWNFQQPVNVHSVVIM